MLENDHYLFGEAFAEALERYLGKTLHDKFELHKIDKSISLPTYLERSYTFFKTRIVGRQCILIAAREKVATPADIAKHVSLVRAAMGAIVIFATPSLNAHNRSRLIAQGVAFVVPGNQLYIPELAMDLREYFRTPKPHGVEGISPAAQAVLFHYILRLDEFATTPSAIAERLRYSPMSIGRAFDELVSVGLAKTKKQGRERHIYFNADKRELTDTARPLLRNPVRSVKHIRNDRPVPSLKLAGETALAKLTDLTPPRTETFAVAARDWKAISVTLELIQVNDFEESFKIETWSYDPAGLSDGPIVDPLSLYAQFHDHQDERVSMAVEKLLENVLW